MLLDRETWNPAPETEREQLTRIVHNARLDAYAAVGWPLIITAILVSDVRYLGGADAGPLTIWIAAMACWAAATWSMSRRDIDASTAAIRMARRDYCILYLANSVLWSIGVLIIVGLRETGTFPGQGGEAVALVNVLFAMLVVMGLGTTLALQNSPHIRVFLCAIGPVGTLPSLSLIFWSGGAHTALGLVLLALTGWLVALGARMNAEFSTRLNLERKLSASRDQAERLKARAEEASRAKSQFMASMSHELRTPLNAILGFSETLGLRIFPPGDARYTQYLWDIHASGKHLLSLIEDILHIQKIESGTKLYNLQPADLAQEIDETRALLSERAARKGVALEFILAGQADAVIDARAMRQAVINLAANAIEHTPEGGHVQVRLARRQRTWLLEVIDNGAGIPPDLAPRIFEAFVTSSNTPYATNTQGTGLGLHITREIVRAHGGRIAFETSPRGTRFVILLPAPDMARKAA